MKSRVSILSAALGALALSPAASATGYESTTAHVEYAEVLSVEPIRRTVEVSTPREECYERPVTVTRSRPVERGYRSGHGDSVLPLLLGGLVGGVVGHQFGKGTGNIAATAAGAVVGSQVGRHIEERPGHSVGYRDESYTRMETHCTTTRAYHTEERVDGYRVDYRYQGKVYSTRMDRHPGDRIPVRVSVVPAD